MFETSVTPVPFDPQMDVALTADYYGGNQSLLPETIQQVRQLGLDTEPPMSEIVAGLPVRYEDRVIPGPEGDITLTIVWPDAEPGTTFAGAVYNIHGGGMVAGSRFSGIETVVDMAIEYNVVGVSVEYRLAPEHPHPAPSEDCYAGLCWVAEHAEELGFDPDKLIVRGGSAGGGLTLAMALMARDRGGPKLAGQMSIAPMIDDRNTSIASRQFERSGTWDRVSNHTGWTALLGDERGGPDVSPYAAPIRATDLSNLPPLFVEVGAAEPFRDEAVEYVSRVWAAGGRADLHVWDGGIHGFVRHAPEAIISKAAKDSQRSWLDRIYRA